MTRIKLNQVVKSVNSLQRIVNVKQYITVKDKLEYAKKYNDLFLEHSNDFESQQFFVGFIFLRMIIVYAYSNIDFEFTYEDYDLLESNGVVNHIIERIGDDYKTLMQVIQSSKLEERDEVNE